MIRWITDRLGTAPASSEAITDDLARVDVRDLVDKHGNSPDAVRAKIDQGVELLRGGARVVVCCDYGISRSNAVAAGILARAKDMALAEAIRTVTQATGEKEIKLEPLNAVRAALGATRSTSGAVRPRVLVTGGTGFLGRKLVAALDDAADIVSVGGEIDLASGALALDLLAQEHGVDQIVHLANPRVFTSNRAMGDTLSMLRNVLDVCRSTGARLIYLSGWEVYSGHDQGELLANERTPMRPKGPYGETKMLCEQLISLQRELYGLDCCIVRSSPVYGAESDKPKFIFNFARKAQDDALIRTHRYRNAFPRLDLLYVDDLMALLRNVVLQRVDGDFNVGGGHLYSTAEIAQMIVAFFGSDSIIEQQQVEDNVTNVMMDSRRARECFGWRPTTRLADMIPILMSAIRRS